MGIDTKTRNFSWAEDYPAAITVCDTEGIIISMNQRSMEQFKKKRVVKNLSAAACLTVTRNQLTP